MIDIGCLTLLWRLTRREGIGLLDLVGLDRTRIIRDASLGLALIPMSLVFIFGGSVVLPPLLGLLADSTDSFAPLWGTTAGLVAVAGITLWGSLRGTRLLAVAGGATRSGVSEPPAS